MVIDNLTEIGSIELVEPFIWHISGRVGYDIDYPSTLITPLRFKDVNGIYAVELRRDLPSSSYSNSGHLKWLREQEWAKNNKEEQF